MRQDYIEFQKRAAEIIAIGADSAKRFRSHWEKERLPFPGAPDPDKRILEKLGQEFKLLRFGRMPAVIVVGADGIIQFAHYGRSAADIPGNAKVLAVIDSLPPPIDVSEPQAGPLVETR